MIGAREAMERLNAEAGVLTLVLPASGVVAFRRVP